MPIRNQQLEDSPRRVSAVVTDPTVQTGEGAFYSKIVSGAAEGFYKDDQGNAIQLTSGGVLVGAGVTSVNGATGTVTIDADDIDDSSTTNKFATAAELSKLAGIEAGAEVNPADVTPSEITAGTETSNRTFSPADVKSMIDTHASGGSAVNEFVITFPSGTNTADRISSATVPSGWTLQTADVVNDPQFGNDSNDLVITWDAGLGTKYAEVTFMESNLAASVFAGGRRILASSHSNPASLKGNSNGTRAWIDMDGIGVNDALDAIIIVKLY